VNFEDIRIINPKMKRMKSGWDEFFPYYAGYSDAFARNILESANLSYDTIVFDPWNGSGTTTSVASEMGIPSIGMDLNPVMIIVARSRSLPASDSDSLLPLALEIIKSAKNNKAECLEADPLLWWFEAETARCIRSIEQSIRLKLLGDLTLTATGTRFEKISSIAATYYVALFNLTKNLAKAFQSSNPTWLRKPKAEENKVFALQHSIFEEFINKVTRMSTALANRIDPLQREYAPVLTRLLDSTKPFGLKSKVDFVLTSPPYCTRIDYTSATRVQLAVLFPTLDSSVEDLSRRMIGSIKVPKSHLIHSPNWGEKCIDFLERLRKHPSKASDGYYLKGHSDYFDKINKSLENISDSLKPSGKAIFVVQDSYYKELHNDVPGIIVEMAQSYNLILERQENFEVSKSLSVINKNARASKTNSKNVESVLCFKKPIYREA
jgi:DNA modification methylase